MVQRGYGRVVLVASVAGKEGSALLPAYSASKAAVISLAKSLGKDLASTGVLINAVTPAGIDAGMTHDNSPEVQGGHASRRSDGTAGHGRRGRADGHLAREPGLQLLNRRGLRPVRRSQHLLIPHRSFREQQKAKLTADGMTAPAGGAHMAKHAVTLLERHQHGPHAPDRR